MTVHRSPKFRLGLIAGIGLAVYLASPHSQSRAQSSDIMIAPVGSELHNIFLSPMNSAPLYRLQLGGLVADFDLFLGFSSNNVEYYRLYQSWQKENRDVINKALKSINEIDREAIKITQNRAPEILSNEEKTYMEIVASFAELSKKHTAEVHEAAVEFDRAIKKESTRRSAKCSFEVMCNFAEEPIVAKEILISSKLRDLLSVRLDPLPDFAKLVDKLPVTEPADEPLVAKIININVADTTYKETLRKAQLRVWHAEREYDDARRDEESARKRFGAMLQKHADEIAAINKVRDKAKNEHRAKLRSSSDQPEIGEIEKFRVKIEAIARKRRKADIGLDVVSESLDKYFDILQKKDQKYADALQALGDFKGKEAKQILRINTNYTFVATFTNRSAEMKDLNRTIKISRQATRDAAYQREIARNTMLKADEETSIASANLEQAIKKSASSQLVIEAYMQAKDGLDASKAGPGVFLLWATNRAAQNIFNPPKVYEPEYRLDGQQSVSQQILGSYFAKDKQEAAARAAKYGSNKAYEHLLTASTNTLKLGQIENEMQKILMARRTGISSTKTLASLLTRYKAQEELYSNAAIALSTRMYGGGKAKLAASVSFDLVKSELKSIGVEAIKRQLADFFEGRAWRTYMRSQQRFVLAVRVFRSFGNIYWENRDTLDGLVSLRKAIKNKYYDEESKLQIELSEKFDVKAGLRFWLLFADENGEASSKPHPGNITVLLDEAILVRKSNSNIFDLSETGAIALRREGGKELTLRVVFN